MQSMSSAHASTLDVRRRFKAGFLRASGTSIVDGAGKTVQLRGASFDGYEYGMGNVVVTHSESDYQKMASWGFNVVRLQFAWAFVEPQPGKYDDSYLSQYVDRDVAWAAKYGLYHPGYASVRLVPLLHLPPKVTLDRWDSVMGCFRVP